MYIDCNIYKKYVENIKLSNKQDAISDTCTVVSANTDNKGGRNTLMSDTASCMKQLEEVNSVFL